MIPTQTFRYLACGGTNTVLNIFIEYLAYTFILKGYPLPIYGNIIIAPEVSAWIIAFSISFPAGFILSRHIVFPESNLHGRIQFFRYALIQVTFIILNYFFIKAFAYYLPMLHPTISYTIICLILTILSYISQRRFTFKTIEEEVVPD